MSFAFSPDGTRIYAFCVGQDILVLDSDNGRLLGTIPLAHRNITGIRATYGLPLLANYQEQNYLLTFAIIVEDSITDTDTLSIGSLDLKDEHPTLQIYRDRALRRELVHRRRNRHLARPSQGVLRLERPVEDRLQDEEKGGSGFAAEQPGRPAPFSRRQEGVLRRPMARALLCMTRTTSSTSPMSSSVIRWPE